MNRKQKEDYLKKLITSIDKFPHVDENYKNNIISIYNNTISFDDEKFDKALVLIQNLVSELNNSYMILNNNLKKSESNIIEEQEKIDELKDIENNFNF